MQKVSKNCPARRMDLASADWRSRCYTMLAFCCACHIASVSVLVALVCR